MDLPESLKNDPHRKKLLQQILDAHDNAVISHEFDENEEIVVKYDKYSVKRIQKLTNELRSYEQFICPEVFINHWHRRSGRIIVDDFGNVADQIKLLEAQLKQAEIDEDFHACQVLKIKINKLRNNG